MLTLDVYKQISGNIEEGMDNWTLPYTKWGDNAFLELTI